MNTMPNTSPERCSAGQQVALLRAWITTRDEQALSQLLHSVAPIVTLVCQRMLGRGQAADDAIQTVYLTLSRQASSISDPRRINAWVHRTACRACLEIMRSDHRRRRRELTAAPGPDTSHTPDDKLARAELDALVDEALDTLPAANRALLVEIYFNDRSLTELASEWGVSPDTLRMRRNRSLHRLRAWLGPRGVSVSIPMLMAAFVEGAQAAAASEVPSVSLGPQAGSGPVSDQGFPLQAVAGSGQLPLFLAIVQVALFAIYVMPQANAEQQGKAAELQVSIADPEPQVIWYGSVLRDYNFLRQPVNLKTQLFFQFPDSCYTPMRNTWVVPADVRGKQISERIFIRRVAAFNNIRYYELPHGFVFYDAPDALVQAHIEHMQADLPGQAADLENTRFCTLLKNLGAHPKLRALASRIVPQNVESLLECPQGALLLDQATRKRLKLGSLDWQLIQAQSANRHHRLSSSDIWRKYGCFLSIADGSLGKTHLEDILERPTLRYRHFHYVQSLHHNGIITDEEMAEFLRRHWERASERYEGRRPWTDLMRLAETCDHEVVLALVRDLLGQGMASVQESQRTFVKARCFAALGHQNAVGVSSFLSAHANKSSAYDKRVRQAVLVAYSKAAPRQAEQFLRRNLLANPKEKAFWNALGYLKGSEWARAQLEQALLLPEPGLRPVDLMKAYVRLVKHDAATLLQALPRIDNLEYSGALSDMGGKFFLDYLLGYGDDRKSIKASLLEHVVQCGVDTDAARKRILQLIRQVDAAIFSRATDDVYARQELRTGNVVLPYRLQAHGYDAEGASRYVKKLASLPTVLQEFAESHLGHMVANHPRAAVTLFAHWERLDAETREDCLRKIRSWLDFQTGRYQLYRLNTLGSLPVPVADLMGEYMSASERRLFDRALRIETQDGRASARQRQD